MRVAKTIRTALSLTLLGLAPAALQASEEGEEQQGEDKEIAELRSSVAGLLKVLVKKDVFTGDQAEDLVASTINADAADISSDQLRPVNMAEELDKIRTQRKALDKELAEQKEVVQKLAEHQTVEPELARMRSQKDLDQIVAAKVQQALQEQQAQRNESVRVRYVPDFLLAEIREKVKAELKEEVAQEIVDGVYDEQTEDGLPIPEVPDWVNTFKLKGDIRLRAQRDMPTDGSGQWIDYQAINDEGKNINTTTVDVDDVSLNPNNADRDRARVRLRLDAEAKFGYSMKAGARLSTGNTKDPVSTNQTLGQSANKYQVVLDRAYLNYIWENDQGDLKLSLTGGRMANPWYSTDLLWDSDIGFEGVAGSLTYKRDRASSFAGMTLRNYLLRGTVGAFPLEEVASNDRDKWLMGGQLEASARLLSMNQFRFGIGYYQYANITGDRHDTFFSMRDPDTDATVPQFMQKGNTLFDVYPDTLAFAPGDDIDMFGLASDFKILNLTASVELLELEPTRLWFVADYVKNLGWDEDEALKRIGGDPSLASNPLSGDHDTGYMLKMEAGTKNLLKPGDWRAFLGYRYLEPDAVLDAYTDSDFHFGGTNSKGWFLGGKYVFEDNVYIGVRYLSAEEVMTPNDLLPLGTRSGSLGMDTLQIDIGGTF
jgi:hypothetical protein